MFFFSYMCEMCVFGCGVVWGFLGGVAGWKERQLIVWGSV